MEKAGSRRRRSLRLNAKQRAAWGRLHTQRLQVTTEQLRRLVAKWYRGLAAEVMRKLVREVSKASEVGVLLFDSAKAGTDLGGVMRLALAERYMETGQEVLDTLGFDSAFTVDNPRARQFLGEREQHMKTVAETAQERVRDSLAEGLEKGETIEELTARVDEWAEAGMERHAVTVARTESAGCLNQAALDGYVQGGATGKEWLSTLSATTRPGHADLDGVAVGIDEDFTLETVDGDTVSCNGPGDPNLPVGEVANCECTVAPVFEEE